MCANPSSIDFFFFFFLRKVFCVSFFRVIGLRDITMIYNENLPMGNYQNTPKVNFVTAKHQTTSHSFSCFYQKFFQCCTRKITNTCILTNDIITANQTIVFITEQKTPLTARHSRNLTFTNPFSLHFKFRIFKA